MYSRLPHPLVDLFIFGGQQFIWSVPAPQNDYMFVMLTKDRMGAEWGLSVALVYRQF